MKLESLAAAVVLVACSAPAPKRFQDRFFSSWNDRRMMCSLGADRTHKWSLDELRASIDHAAAEKLVVHTYGHAPTFDLDEYLPLFAYAKDHGVETITYRELADHSHPRAGWAFSIDDDEVDSWYAWRAKLKAAG